MTDQPSDSSEDFERALAESKDTHYVLRLYVAGNTTKSAEAIENIRKVCETHLAGRFQLEVIDVYQQPDLARQEQVLATPMLIKGLPLPLRRVIGNLSRKDRVLVALDLLPLS